MNGTKEKEQDWADKTFPIFMLIQRPGQAKNQGEAKKKKKKTSDCPAYMTES